MTNTATTDVSVKNTKLTKDQKKLVGSVFWRSMWLMFCTSYTKQQGVETLENLGVDDVKIAIVDKGALDCTIKARVEGAIFRSVKQLDNLPWGGAIR